MVEEFEKIARKAILDAQGVKCPFRLYVSGLRLICEMLQDELQLCESEEGR